MSKEIHDLQNEAYGETAALRYNIFESRPSGFALQMAPKIFDFYKKSTNWQDNKCLLDVACGTGQLVSYFLDHDFEAVGLDKSSSMLKYARGNNSKDVTNGRCHFKEIDSSNFQLEEKFGLAVCTFNGLNHLANFTQIEGSIASVFRALIPGGYFIFDINTALGLKNTVDTIDVIDTEEDIVIRKRIFDGKHVILNASGCFLHNNKWTRYKETIFKIIIDTQKLRKSMLNSGWSTVTYTTSDLTNPVEDPEAEQVAYVIARKPI